MSIETTRRIDNNKGFNVPVHNKTALKFHNRISK